MNVWICHLHVNQCVFAKSFYFIYSSTQEMILPNFILVHQATTTACSKCQAILILLLEMQQKYDALPLSVSFVLMFVCPSVFLYCIS